VNVQAVAGLNDVARDKNMMLRELRF